MSIISRQSEVFGTAVCPQRSRGRNPVGNDNENASIKEFTPCHQSNRKKSIR